MPCAGCTADSLEARREVAEHPRVGCSLVVEGDGVAVQEAAVDDRFALLASLAAAVVERDARCEAVLVGEPHGQVEDVGAAAVGEAVPVEVRGCQSRVDHGRDLCAQLAFDVARRRPCEERVALGRRVDVELGGVWIEERGHVGLGGDRAPAVSGQVADEREVDAERDVRAFAEQPYRVRRRGARDHQAARACDAVLDRVHDGSVDRLVHPESSQFTISTRASGANPKSSLDSRSTPAPCRTGHFIDLELPRAFLPARAGAHRWPLPARAPASVPARARSAITLDSDSNVPSSNSMMGSALGPRHLGDLGAPEAQPGVLHQLVLDPRLVERLLRLPAWVAVDLDPHRAAPVELDCHGSPSQWLW